MCYRLVLVGRSHEQYSAVSFKISRKNGRRQMSALRRVGDAIKYLLATELAVRPSK